MNVCRLHVRLKNDQTDVSVDMYYSIMDLYGDARQTFITKRRQFFFL